MHHQSFPSHAALSLAAARMIADYISANPGSLLCLAAGDTPLRTFAELVKMQNAGEVDLGSVSYIGLDEWVGLGPADKGSCHQVMHDHFYTPARIPPARVRVFDGLADPAAECAAMDAWLASHGGIGLTLLGVGMNGHVGFNEPDGPDGPGAILVPLDGTTKAVSVKYFGKSLPVTHGVTLSLSALLRARQVIIMASGEKKAHVIRRAFHSPPTPALPASMLQTHPRLTLLTDFNV